MPKRKLNFCQKFARMSGWIMLSWDSVESIYPQINLSMCFQSHTFLMKNNLVSPGLLRKQSDLTASCFWSSTRGFLKLSKWTPIFHLGELYSEDSPCFRSSRLLIHWNVMHWFDMNGIAEQPAISCAKVGRAQHWCGKGTTRALAASCHSKPTKSVGGTFVGDCVEIYGCFRK